MLILKSDLAMSTKYAEQHIIDARSRFYPGWWTVPAARPASRQPLYRQPLYRVVCHGQAECELARLARPDGVRVQFVHQLSAARQQRLDDLMARSNQGVLTEEERAELKNLVDEVEDLVLWNAQQLAHVLATRS
jgi:hypothetical protein